MYFCVSCRTPITNQVGSVILKCPNCGTEIARCAKCRRMGVKYKCPKCGLELP